MPAAITIVGMVFPAKRVKAPKGDEAKPAQEGAAGKQE